MRTVVKLEIFYNNPEKVEINYNTINWNIVLIKTLIKKINKWQKICHPTNLKHLIYFIENTHFRFLLMQLLCNT